MLIRRIRNFSSDLASLSQQQKLWSFYLSKMAVYVPSHARQLVTIPLPLANLSPIPLPLADSPAFPLPLADLSHHSPSR